jgi:SEC-C motif-containing protein
MRCPCGRSLDYEACCGVYINGWDTPATAEDLMRSRYTAYARREIDYLVSTHDPKNPPDRTAIARWAREAEFLGLEIVRAGKGQKDDDEGTVEFLARFKERGREHVHHESSRFRRIDGRWFYIDAS